MNEELKKGPHGPDALHEQEMLVANLLCAVAYAGFFNGGGSVTSHRDDFKILSNTTSSRCDVTGSVNLHF